MSRQRGAVPPSFDRDDLAHRARENARTLIGNDTFVEGHGLRRRAESFARIEFEVIRIRGLRAIFKDPPMREAEIVELWLEEARTLLSGNKSELVRARKVIEVEAGLQREREKPASSFRATAKPQIRPVSPRSAPPAAQKFGVSPIGAESLVCAWMRHLGEADAHVTRFTGDGGIDVASSDWIVQVKHYAGTVGVQAIREFAGVAAVDKRKAAFFTSTGYAAGAISFANEAGIALLLYSAEEGWLVGANPAGDILRTRGV